MKDASVVIGLGGIGSDICAKVSEMIPEHLPDKEMVKFVAVDTDINSLSDLKRKGFRGITIQISDNTTVGLCVENQRPEIDAWFPDNPVFTKKPMTEGAGQMRAISRLALHAAVKEGKLGPLYKVIEDLRLVSKNPSEQPIRVYIISSLSGGTGSGIFLPLAMYLERYMKKLFGDFDSICKGFFILPSAMKELTDTFLEKRSLDANSYAAVKELSAFLAAEDEGEKTKYKLALELANDGENSISLYERAGYEYCYLFGKVNRLKLMKSSFEEVKKAVANAVYMQVCSPIRGLNNSKEDNMPKFLAEQMQLLKAKKFCRFGAIGCGEIVYPYNSLRSYYALRWAIDTMSNHWKKYDVVYFEKDREEQEKRKRGKKSQKINRAEEYVNAIKLAERNDMFAEEIRETCRRDGYDSWELYLTAVSKEIGSYIQNLKNEREHDSINGDGLFERHLQEVQANNIKRQEKNATIREVEALFEQMQSNIRQYLDENGRYISKNLFTYNPDGEPYKPCDFVYWVNSEDGFIHPNAVRYFLYNLIKSVGIRKLNLDKEIKSREQSVQCIKKYSNNKTKIKGSSLVKWAGDYQKARAALYEKAHILLEQQCLDCLEEYAAHLIRAYEEFYEYYSDMLHHFEDEVANIEQELDRQSGISSFYVCADASCRDIVFKKLQDRREYTHIESALSAFIFRLLQEPVQADRMKRFFPEIKQYWIDGVEKEFKELLDVNILHALKLEEEYKTGCKLDAENIKELIKQAKVVLEAPLVRYVTRKETREIGFCCFNSVLESERGIYKEVVDWLLQTQGISDPYYCSPYQMIFYCSIVGIEAYDVLEFYHGRENSIIDDGEAFLHYEDSISNIVLNDEGGPVLVPHIDRKWYSYLNLPDTHKETQYKKEINIAMMFLDAYISGKLVCDMDKKGFHYADRAEKIFDRLVQCHQYLYECPLCFNSLKQGFDQDMTHDVQLGKTFEECRLVSAIGKKNIYDILLEYAATLREEEYSAEKAELLISAVEGLLLVCVSYFKNVQRRQLVIQKLNHQKSGMRSLTEKDKENRMVNVMYQMIQDYFVQRGY